MATLAVCCLGLALYFNRDFRNIYSGLPPFDFLLLASFFAAKGSPRLYRWFQENRYIGPLLREWQQHRRIPRKAKVLSTLSMTFAATIIIWKIPHLWLVLTLIACMLGVLIWMWRKA